jgi:hypothetical protein
MFLLMQTSKSIGKSPFFANFGYYPQLEIGLLGPKNNAPPVDFLDILRELH